MKKNLTNSEYFCGLLALCSLSTANAEVLGQWTFNDTTSVATALQSSAVASGAFVSSLVINPSHDSAGVNAVPNSVNDGYGFGGNSGQNVMFFVRAEYFNDSPDTANGGIRPVGRVTTWDSSNTTVANSPISFTVTANAISTLTIDSLEVHQISGSALIGAFQLAGSLVGPSVTLPGGDQTVILSLRVPVIIEPGQSATFTMYTNSGGLNTGHSLNQMSLNGSVSRNTTIPPVTQWTFDNTGTGPTAERLPVALGASSVASGLTVTPLNINASFDFAGFNNLPGSGNDGFGFGGNAGQEFMFIDRANYFNGGGPVTTWGNPGSDPANTTVGNSPLSFTVTANSQTSFTLNSVTIASGIDNPFIVHFQEAGAIPGLGSPGGNFSETASLNSPVDIGPGQSKTFTINLNSGILNSNHGFNTISLNGRAGIRPNQYYKVNTGGQSVTWNQALTSLRGVLIKDGAGTLTLTNTNNSFSGGTTVNSGTLRALVNGSLGTGEVVIADGAILELNAAATLSPKADLILSGVTSSVQLNFTGTQPVHSLSFDGGVTLAAAGTWGSVGSGATYTDSRLTGPGLLLVASINQNPKIFGTWCMNWIKSTETWWNPNRYEGATDFLGSFNTVNWDDENYLYSSFVTMKEAGINAVVCDLTNSWNWQNAQTQSMQRVALRKRMKICVAMGNIPEPQLGTFESRCGDVWNVFAGPSAPYASTYLQKDGKPVLVCYVIKPEFDAYVASTGVNRQRFTLVWGAGESDLSSNTPSWGWQLRPKKGIVPSADAMFVSATIKPTQGDSPNWHKSQAWLDYNFKIAKEIQPGFTIVGGFDDVFERNAWMPADTTGAVQEHQMRDMTGAINTTSYFDRVKEWITGTPSAVPGGALPDGCYRVTNQASALSLEMPNTVGSNEGQAGLKLLQSTSEANLDRYFSFYHLGSNVYRINSLSSGLFLEVTNNDSGLQVQQNWNNTELAQRWILLPMTAGGYVIQNQASGKVLDVNSLLSGTPVVQNPLAPGDQSQQWSFGLVAQIGPSGVFIWDGTVNSWTSAHWNAGAGLVSGPIGPSNVNSAIINGGTVTFSGNDTFGDAATTTTPPITINSAGTLASGGTFNTIWDLTLNGGTLLANGGLNNPNGAFALKGTVNVGGMVASSILAGAGSFNTVSLGTSSGGTTTFSVADVTASTESDLTISTVLNDNSNIASSMSKTGMGTLTLSGVNTYTGNTSVTLGTLALVGGSQTSPITVSSGAALGFTVGSPTTSTSSVTFSGTNAKVTVSGTPAATTLMTASSITGTPVLDPAIPGFELAIEGSGTLLKLKSTDSAYTTWANGFPGFTPTTGILDFENDGIRNLLEFVLGGNPTTNDSPSIRPTVITSGNDLVVTFNRTDISESEPVTVKVQTSPDLVTWADFATIGAASDILSGYTVAENGAAADTVVVTIPKAAVTKKFARVSAE